MSSKRWLAKKTCCKSLLWLWLYILVLILTGCQYENRGQLYQQQLFVFGTLIDISILDDNQQQSLAAISQISTELEKMHTDLHPWSPGTLATTNQLLMSQQTFPAPAEIMPLITASQELSLKTEGLFNPAIGQLIKLWQFDQFDDEKHQFRLPATEQISVLLAQNPQMSDIRVVDKQLRTDNPAVTLDFGAFAKGVAVDRAIDILKELGINNALVNAGGDLKVIGNKGGRPWRIGIKNPETSSRQPVIATIELNDGESLFTSGDYERFFTYQGQHYHHIIDPRTGYPATQSSSVTILANNAGIADAASTALFIAGPENWQSIAHNLGIQYVMLIAPDNTIYLSEPMARRINLIAETKAIIQPLL